MTCQKNLQLLTTLMDAYIRTSQKNSVNISKWNEMFFKKGYHQMSKKVTKIVHTIFGRQFLNYVTKQRWVSHLQRNKSFSTRWWWQNLYYKHLKHGKISSGQVDYNKKTSIRNWLRKERISMKVVVSVVSNMLENISSAIKKQKNNK